MNFSYSLTENVRRFPDKVAVVHGDTRLSYRELDDRVSSIAHELRAAGTGPGSRVALLLWNCAEFVEAYYACMRLGASCVPLNYRLAAEELCYELGHSASSVLFTEECFHDTVESITDQLPELRLVITTATSAPGGWRRHHDLASHPGVTVADEPAAMDDVQRIMYTSGTTARPKAAMTTHGQVYWGAVTRALEFGLSSADVSLTVGPLYHVGALDTFTTPMLYLGGTVVIHSRFEPEAVVRAIQDHAITNCWLAPTMLNMIFQLPDVTSYDTDSLRVVIGGGEKAPLPLLERLARDWPTVGFYDVYGLTECQGLATHLSPERARDKAGSVGLPTRGRELRIVDDAGRDVAPEQPGEVLVRGPVVFPGYFDAPEATADTLRDGWLHTGDVARRDDEGFVYIVDRKKDMILSGAENIAPAEVERVIDELAEVLEVAVVAMPDERWSEVPAAFVAPRAGQRIDVDTVVAHCTQRLAKFKVPRVVNVVESLPRTPSGKVMKWVLREQLPTT
ncbi:MAG: AMP-binding protein [Pseudonocardiaceae bacterium]|nr:AMP-binding protein [Pseudonocardiaceae bacterium]